MGFLLFFYLEGGIKLKHNDYLKKYIVDQFDYLEYKKLVEIFINLIETLQITIGDYETGISITSNYELNYSGYSNKLSNSKIESFIIKDYNTECKAKICIKKFTIAFNRLNDNEKKIFYSTFIDKTKDEIIISEFNLCSKDLNKIRKSAVIKFSLYLGFDKIINQVLQ